MKESGEGVEGRRGGCKGKRKVIFDEDSWREVEGMKESEMLLLWGDYLIGNGIL